MPCSSCGGSGKFPLRRRRNVYRELAYASSLSSKSVQKVAPIMKTVVKSTTVSKTFDSLATDVEILQWIKEQYSSQDSDIQNVKVSVQKLTTVEVPENANKSQSKWKGRKRSPPRFIGGRLGNVY